jgi:hypothetical protein
MTLCYKHQFSADWPPSPRLNSHRLTPWLARLAWCYRLPYQTARHGNRRPANFRDHVGCLLFLLLPRD